MPKAKSTTPENYHQSWLVFEPTKGGGWVVQRDQQGQRYSFNFKSATSNARLIGGVYANYWEMPEDENEWAAYLSELKAKQSADGLR